VSTVELCVDAASPELSVPCPTDPLTINYPRSLPDTGDEIVVLVWLAFTILLLGVVLYVGSRI
jgi:LPXTG-motif cell wall-anchored protein